MKESPIVLKGGGIEYHTENYIEYTKSIKARSSNTVCAYTQDLKCFSRYLNIPASKNTEFDFNQECVTGYLAHLRQTLGLKPATVRRRVLSLRGFSYWLVERGVISKSPYDDLTLDLRIPKRLPRPVDPLTIRQLLAVKTPRHYETGANATVETQLSSFSLLQITQLIVQLMLVTGIRVGEVASIRIQDVSTDGGTIHIIGKGNKERLVYVENKLLAETISLYRRQRLDRDTTFEVLFLNSRSKPLTPQTIRKRLKTL